MIGRMYYNCVKTICYFWLCDVWSGIAKLKRLERIGSCQSNRATTADAAYTCGTGLYGSDESLRRVVSVTFPIASLK